MRLREFYLGEYDSAKPVAYEWGRIVSAHSMDGEHSDIGEPPVAIYATVKYDSGALVSLMMFDEVPQLLDWCKVTYPSELEGRLVKIILQDEPVSLRT